MLSNHSHFLFPAFSFSQICTHTICHLYPNHTLSLSLPLSLTPTCSQSHHTHPLPHSPTPILTHSYTLLLIPTLLSSLTLTLSPLGVRRDSSGSQSDLPKSIPSFPTIIWHDWYVPRTYTLLFCKEYDPWWQILLYRNNEVLHSPTDWLTNCLTEKLSDCFIQKLTDSLTGTQYK